HLHPFGQAREVGVLQRRYPQGDGAGWPDTQVTADVVGHVAQLLDLSLDSFAGILAHYGSLVGPVGDGLPRDPSMTCDLPTIDPTRRSHVGTLPRMSGGFSHRGPDSPGRAAATRTVRRACRPPAAAQVPYRRSRPAPRHIRAGRRFGRVDLGD